MKKKVIIGIDFSKLTLDVTCLSVENIDLRYHNQFSNSEIGCMKMIKWVKQYFPQSSNWLFCGEYTGIYSLTTCSVLNKSGLDIWLENPSQIKLSSGFNRDKNDKVDSYRIALYCHRFLDRTRLYKPQSEALLKINELIRFKDRLTKSISQLLVPAKEMMQVRKDNEVTIYVDQSSKEIADHMKAKLKEIDIEIMNLIENEPELKRNYKLIMSVVGVGIQTTTYLLVYTGNFDFFDTPRQLACYSGIAPFSKTSGTTLKGKPHVSHYANKKIKTLLHMCALNAIRYDPVIKEYYQRKINEGKHKMNVLNNVRNKLIVRIWAVIENGEMYERNYNTHHGTAA